MRDYGVGSRFNFNLRLRQLVYLALCVLEILLAFRLGMKLLGANAANAFVSFIYSLSGFFVFPFAGIFKPMSMNHLLNIHSVLEWGTIIAMLAYAIIAWIIVKLIRLGRSSSDY